MLNKAVLMGRLTRDPELRHTQSNTPVTSFTLAVDRRFGNKQNEGSDQPTADFINIVAWSATAEFVSKWFHKGMLVAVAGRIQSRTYKDRDGNNRTAVEVVAEEVHFAEPKRSGEYSPHEGAMPSGTDSSPLPPATSEFNEISGDGEDDLPF